MLTPLPTETQPAFCIRFHEAMQDAMPRTDERDRAMMKAWNGAKGPSHLDREAYNRFGKDHKRVGDVPIFAEHTTERDGTKVIYDRSALVSILDRCNERIEDTGDFAPIAEGHTPDSSAVDRGAKMPPILGYAGPYRLGQIGNKNPRYAIFATEWHDKAEAEKLRKLPRRSPEVWMEARMEDRFFDPIAALGAETPRLDMGISRFRRCIADADSRRLVMKYSAPVHPGGSNTFIPGTDDEDRDNYEAGSMEANPETIAQFIDAFMETAPMQWVLSQMQGGDAPVADVPGAGAPPQGAAPTDPPAEQPPAAAPADMPADDAPPVDAPPDLGADEEPEPMNRYECDDEDRDMMSRYMAGDCDDDEFQEYKRNKSKKRSHKRYEAGEDDDTPTDDYSKRARSADAKDRYARLERDVKQLKEENRKLKTERVRADRYAKLTELRRTHSFDLSDEVKKCDPEKMSDDQFVDHCDTIERYARMPVDAPSLVIDDSTPAERVEQEQAAKSRVDKAKRYHRDQLDKGVLKSWDECLAHVEHAENNGAAV